jgi:SAM-dependent methyltransferase
VRETPYVPSVARRYDNNVVRSWVPLDQRLAILRGDRPRGVDLACGTGIYIAAQRRHFPGALIEWHGADASAAMLAVAEEKLGFACRFREARAEKLPYADDYFDYVVTRFAFHHFTDKTTALQEMRRVLAPGGLLRIENLAPELSPNWWLYRFFPEARPIDAERFWPVARIGEALERMGLAVEVIQRPVTPLSLRHVHEEVKNRETSQLLLIDDAAYARGLAAVTEALSTQGDAPFDPGLVLIDILAR